MERSGIEPGSGLRCDFDVLHRILQVGWRLLRHVVSDVSQQVAASMTVLTLILELDF